MSHLVLVDIKISLSTPSDEFLKRMPLIFSKTAQLSCFTSCGIWKENALTLRTRWLNTAKVAVDSFTYFTEQHCCHELTSDDQTSPFCRESLFSSTRSIHEIGVRCIPASAAPYKKKYTSTYPPALHLRDVAFPGVRTNCWPRGYGCECYFASARYKKRSRNMVV